MGSRRRISQLFLLLSFIIAVPSEAVTVPLCPTNKIAPHRRHIQNWDYNARTFGAYFDLLRPNNQYQNDMNDAPSDLQETPDDDPDDCGEIEDYDENDLSSITPQVQRRQGRDQLYGWFRPPNYPFRPPSGYPPSRPERPPYRPERPPVRPERPPVRPERPPVRPERPPVRPERPPQRPERPPITNFPATKPPYWSGGFFGSNTFRPPLYQDPTDNIKPIYENSEHFQQPYQPTVVGGPSGDIIGVSPLVPSAENYETTTRPFFPNRTPRYDLVRTPRPYPTRTPSTLPSYPTRGQRPRNLNNNGILGSFVDLLFK